MRSTFPGLRTRGGCGRKKRRRYKRDRILFFFVSLMFSFLFLSREYTISSEIKKINQSTYTIVLKFMVYILLYEFVNYKMSRIWKKTMKVSVHSELLPKPAVDFDSSTLQPYV